MCRPREELRSSQFSLLVLGGLGDDGAPATSVELYRPFRETFELIPDASLARWNHTAARLPGGFVLVLGGMTLADGVPTPAQSLLLYDPVRGRIDDAGQLPDTAGLTEQSVTMLPDGRLLIAGGLGRDGNRVNTAFVTSFDTNDGTVDVSATDRLDVARAGHAAVALCDGTVLVIGGGAVSQSSGAERYNPTSDLRR